jgi:hypothetical protein
LRFDPATPPSLVALTLGGASAVAEPRPFGVFWPAPVPDAVFLVLFAIKESFVLGGPYEKSPSIVSGAGPMA